MLDRVGSSLAIALICLALLLVVGSVYALGRAGRPLYRAFRTCNTDWIAIRPSIASITVANLPEPIRNLVRAIEPLLRAEGFERVAAAHAPHLSPYASYTYVVFVNRLAAIRVSVMGAQERATGTDEAVAYFVTDLTDGPSIVTDLVGGEAPEMKARVLERLAEHRLRLEAIVATRSTDAVRVAPEVGRELDWLSERIAIVAAESAKNLGMRPDREGKCYRFSLLSSLRHHVHQESRPKPARRRQRFDVVVTA